MSVITGIPLSRSLDFWDHKFWGTYLLRHKEFVSVEYV